MKELEGILLAFSLNKLTIKESVEMIDSLYINKTLTNRKVVFENFKTEIFAWNYKNKQKYSVEMLNAFIVVWGKEMPSGKFKFQEEKAFKIGGRLATFSKMNKQFQVKKNLDGFKRAMGSLNPLK